MFVVVCSLAYSRHVLMCFIVCFSMGDRTKASYFYRINIQVFESKLSLMNVMLIKSAREPARKASMTNGYKETPVQ